MNEHNTASLVAEQVEVIEGFAEQTYDHHVHGPFTFLMNQNHNALRGCVTCGQAWVGSMAGAEDNLRWHPVAEPPEEED